MKKIFLTFAVLSALVSCKKETTTTTNSTNTQNNPTNEGKLGAPITDIEGNIYKTVIIGSQQWMAENLKVTKYNDGTVIKQVEVEADWRYNDSAAWCYYNNDAANNIKHGKLYNWNVIDKSKNGNRNVCPVGWHVPSGSDWETLGNTLGGVFVAGGKLKMKDTTDWNSPSNGSNSSLFSAYPSGVRNVHGSFEGVGNVAQWWSSDEEIYNNMNAKTLIIYYINNQFSLYNDFKYSGSSIRCIKD